MEFMRKLVKRPVTWIVVFVLVLASGLAVRGFYSAGAGTEPAQTDGAQQATASVDAADEADTVTGNAGVSAVDVEDEESGANDDAGGDVEDDPSALIPSAGTPTINQKLTWEAINSFPIKSADMSTDELRQLCVDFLRFAKTALWTPKEDVSFIRNKGGSQDSMSAGIVYGGLPYVGVASGSVYRLMDYIDESTGVVDIRQALGGADLSQQLAMAQLKYFGNQCSIGAYWGWGRVVNSADYVWTQNVVPANDFVMLGDYTGFDIDSVTNWADPAKSSTNVNTVTVCTALGEQKMYENYAKFQMGDGMVQYTTAGHIVMVASNAHVEYLSDGTIDGENSYITVLDQAQRWQDGENASGDKFRYKNNVDAQWTFDYLYQKSYVPFTYKEFLGTDPVEETEVSFSHSGSTITKSQLFASKVTANYGISDIYAIVTDESGAEVYRHAVRTGTAGNMKMTFAESGANVNTWGTLSGGTYNVEIVVQLATGERPTIYIGQLIA